MVAWRVAKTAAWSALQLAARWVDQKVELMVAGMVVQKVAHWVD